MGKRKQVDINGQDPNKYPSMEWFLISHRKELRLEEISMQMCIEFEETYVIKQGNVLILHLQGEKMI